MSEGKYKRMTIEERDRHWGKEPMTLVDDSGCRLFYDDGRWRRIDLIESRKTQDYSGCNVGNWWEP